MSSTEIRVLPVLDPATALGAQWESLVRANPASGFMQSLHWAEVKRRQGLTSFHLGVFHNDELIGGALFYSPIKRTGAGILVAPEGPVLPWENEPLITEALRLIIDTAQAHANQLGVMSMRIEPRLTPPPLSALREFGRAPVNLVPNETLYVDLSTSRETLLEGMRPKGRYNIAVSVRHGVTVLENSSGAGVQEFHSIVSEAGNRDDFDLEPLSFFEHLAAIMCPAGHARFLFSKHEGDILGALLLMTYGNRATYLYGGISNQKRNLMSGYALQWAAITKAKELGCTTYDFYGIDPFRAPEHRYARFSQFKSQFGGQVMRFIGAQDYFFLDNLADAFIKVVNEAKVQPPEQLDSYATNTKSVNFLQNCLV